MEREDFVRLAGSAGQALLAQIDYSSTTDVLALVKKLRSDGHDPATVAAVLTQAKLRKRGQAKFGEFAAQMLFTEAGLEQASRLKVAALHAGSFRAAGIAEVADLGCGIGAESMAMASLGINVHAFELDEVTAAVATYNLAPFENATVEIADVEQLDGALPAGDAGGDDDRRGRGRQICGNRAEVVKVLEDRIRAACPACGAPLAAVVNGRCAACGAGRAIE
jgi:hypothetical protein